MKNLSKKMRALTRRGLTLLLCAALILPAAAAPASAKPAEETPSEKTAETKPGSSNQTKPETDSEETPEKPSEEKPAPPEEDHVFHIRSKEDWKRFASGCRLDTWSKGLVVSLDKDLNLSGCVPAPTFGGVFKGNGHTLSGLFFTDEGSVQGLFRYIREGAVVQDLTLSAVIAPTGTPAKVGGLVGENSGSIESCNFTGVVTGSSSVGGIAGVNTVSGRIEDCTTNDGAITGEHYVGGVAGENYGSVVRCTNHLQVNTKAVKPAPQLDNVDWKKLNDTENAPVCTDVGGIVGYSRGLLQLCLNSGPVGYYSRT